MDKYHKAVLLLLLLLVIIFFILVYMHAETRELIAEARQQIEQAEAEQAELLRERDALLERVDELRREREEVMRRMGEWLDKWQAMEVEATAYTLECGYPWDDGITFTGTEATAGQTIAVDPSVIPLGSQVWVEGLGWMLAEDIGGAVKGEMIDIYMGAGPEARRLAMRWGRQDVRVIYPGGETRHGQTPQTKL